MAVKLGILSDAAAHFTPEFYNSLQKRTRIESEGGEGETETAKVAIGYFEASLEEIERALTVLASVHLQILSLFNWCYDGMFQCDPEFTRLGQEARPSVRHGTSSAAVGGPLAKPKAKGQSPPTRPSPTRRSRSRAGPQRSLERRI